MPPPPELAPAPPVGPPTFMPSSCSRPSSMRPPWAEKLLTSAPPRRPPTSSVPRDGHAGDEDGDVLDVARRGQLGDEAALQHVLPHGALHVDDRCFAGDGDRFLDPADAELGVNRRSEVAGELDALRCTVAKPASAKVTR